jgi:hypothetical protein
MRTIPLALAHPSVMEWSKIQTNWPPFVCASRSSIQHRMGLILSSGSFYPCLNRLSIVHRKERLYRHLDERAYGHFKPSAWNYSA